ncbi:hypothetical protein EST38_g246 [Candolleomyces aberdarensis]|uniref:UDENN domain-containing protein n=1 Tax=Candolleomyces aberdarensis TaxID=2316362 RepID=A0A4Q2DZZ4_9AGAR|nr:hypothetical protein EST38_g246 [Candolleomyces aberdarensis]
MSMLPDGAEAQLDDWTIFFLNQTPFNTISPVLALDTPETQPIDLPGDEDEEGRKKPELLCVLNLVRTKHDKTLDRGAKVMALAICTRHPYIQIFKPLLLMALDDYFSNPSQDCLARLFDAVNAIDLTGAPILSRPEKMIMRASERKDIFAERFAHISSQQTTSYPGTKPPTAHHKSTNSTDSYSSFEDGLLMRSRDRPQTQERKRDPVARTEDGSSSSGSHGQQTSYSPSDSSFSLGGSAVWVGDESGLDLATKDSSVESSSVTSGGSMLKDTTITANSRKRRSTGASSSSSQLLNNALRPSAPHSFHDHSRSTPVKDTHFYHTMVAYKDHHLPIKMPLATFPEEVGDYSLITLIKVFSNYQQVTGPLHPHLHTNGPQTHPIIILFNALVTGKKIIFLGHRRPAGEVSSFVLAACALGSGCGAVLRGFIERAFPYANLRNRDDWESVPAYIAGVTNPIFESSKLWDLLLDISTGNVTVAKDIHGTYPVPNPIMLSAPLITRTGTLKTELSVGSEEEIAKIAKEGAKADAYKDNNADRIFIDDIRAAIDDHFGESLVRLRFTEYVMRSPFSETPGHPPQLGSGLSFNDEASCYKELVANGHRIEAWRKTNSYQYLVSDYVKYQTSSSIKGFDVVHQLMRFRYAKNMSDSEALTIMRTMVDNARSYEQIVELLACLPHGGGLMSLAFGLHHPRESIREATVDLFNQLRSYPVGVLFLQALNHFQRYAYVRQAHARERRALEQQQDHRGYFADWNQTPVGTQTRMHSNSVVSVSDRSNNAF